MRTSKSAVVACLLLAVGCVVESTDAIDSVELDETESELIGGTKTYAFPAIGRIVELPSGQALCSGSLVNPYTVLTNAHCYNFTTKALGTFGGYFEIEKVVNGIVRTWRYPIVRNKVFAGPYDPVKKDLALAQLAYPVPANVATPLRIATVAPGLSDPVRIFGYGCTNRDTLQGAFVKRVFSTTWPMRTRRTCAGDSGGPVLNAANQIVLANVGFKTGLIGYGNDVFAWVHYYATHPLGEFYGTLQAEIAAMAKAYDCRKMLPEQCGSYPRCEWAPDCGTCNVLGMDSIEGCARPPTCGAARDCLTTKVTGADRCSVGPRVQYCCPLGHEIINGKCEPTGILPCDYFGDGLDCRLEDPADPIDDLGIVGSNHCFLGTWPNTIHAFCCNPGQTIVKGACKAIAADPLPGEADTLTLDAFDLGSD